jgi:hypothetical protein
MPDSGMQKHGGIYCRKRAERTGNEFVRYESVGFIKHAGVDRKVDPINKNGDIQC